MTCPAISQRGKVSPPSPIRKLLPLADEAKAKGIHVLELNLGQPDLLPPKEFLDGLKEFGARTVPYERPRGAPALRAAWSSFIKKSSELTISAEDIIITAGASEALLFLFSSICDPMDEVIVFEPFYANYLGLGYISGVKFVAVPSSFDNGFKFPDAEQIVKRITSRTRAILICNPCNPTGNILDRSDLEMLVAIAEERNLFLISDETYREGILDGGKSLSVFDVKASSPHLAVVDSLSKRFSLCGARIGMIASSNAELLNASANYASARLSCGFIDQYAAAHMLERIDPAATLEALNREYRDRRDALYDGLSKYPEIEVHQAKAAFYSLLRVKGAQGEALCRFLLSEFSSKGETVFVAPASGFYSTEGSGLNEIRAAFVLRPDLMKRGGELLGEGARAFLKRR